MIDVYIVIGLPGSGKTHYAQNLSEQMGLRCFDDCLVDLAEWESAVAHIAAGNSCILINPRFCNPTALNELNQRLRNIEGVSINIVLRYFQNEPEICALNASRRDKPVAEWFIRHLSEKYLPPADSMPCYRHPPEDTT